MRFEKLFHLDFDDGQFLAVLLACSYQSVHLCGRLGDVGSNENQSARLSRGGQVEFFCCNGCLGTDS